VWKEKTQDSVEGTNPRRCGRKKPKTAWKEENITVNNIRAVDALRTQIRTLHHFSVLF
jgi:hypothetical protein